MLITANKKKTQGGRNLALCFYTEETMKELNIDTGLVTYNLNDAVQVTFNPTDSKFGERLFNIFEELDKKQNEYIENINNKKDSKELFEYSRELDKEMRGYLFTLFDMDIVTPLIGNINVFALAGGLPIWANILTALVDEMDSAVTANNELSKKRVDKYTKKYTKKYHN